MKTIHNVHILDRSGSMQGGKYDNAIAGINNEMKELDGYGKIRYTMTVIEFCGLDGKCNMKEHYFMTPKMYCEPVKGAGAKGMTPLNEAVGRVIEKLLRKTKKDERVIITIFTDGYENSSQGRYQNKASLKELINDVENNHNFTVTFAGVKEDVEKVVFDLNIKIGNTMVHNNTADSIKTFYKDRQRALKSYSMANVSTTENFFKKNED